MYRRVLMPAMLVAVVAVASSVLAEETKKECPIATGMKNLPQIAYLVGEETTHCEVTAGKLAEKSGDSILFLVGKDKFENSGKAKLALLTATQDYVTAFAEPKTCKVSGTTTIAGTKAHCSESAAKLASLLVAARDGVTQSYQVGEEKCDCPVAAAALAKTSGEPKLFVVGKEKTSCETTAKLNLARAQYKAMLQALAKAQQETESEESAS